MLLEKVSFAAGIGFFCCWSRRGTEAYAVGLKNAKQTYSCGKRDLRTLKNGVEFLKFRWCGFGEVFSMF